MQIYEENMKLPPKWYNLCDKLTYYTFSGVIYSFLYRKVLHGCLLIIHCHNIKVFYRAQNEAYKIEKTKKWEKSMNDRELER